MSPSTSSSNQQQQQQQQELSTSFSSTSDASTSNNSSSTSTSLTISSSSTKSSSSRKSSRNNNRRPPSPAATSSVQVVVRVRPLNDREKKDGTLPVVSASTLDRTVTVIKGQGSRQIKSSYKFDNVFTSFSTQEDVFEETLQPIIRDVLMGYESTVFAYGQTGTGKTHTMEGDLSQIQEYGVIPRSAAAIFDALQQNPDYLSSSVHCSLLEIYNEELSDLLMSATNSDSTSASGGNINSNGGGNTNNNSKGGNNKPTKLAIMEGEKGPFCRGLSESKVESAEDLLLLMKKAHLQRHTGETDMNKESSRSHCIFTLRVESKRKLMDGSILEVGGKLHCVDLAGSECAKSCGNAGRQQAARERERMNINRSLLTLGRVVKLLKDNATGKSVRIPYRDSKLTRILQESLGGRCKTCLIATISPSITAIDESMSTLNYAQAANGIINKPVTTSLMSVGSGVSPTGGLIGVVGGGDNGNGGQSVEHWNAMEVRLEYLQSQCEEAQQALARKHIQQQELVERAEKAEVAQRNTERMHQQALHDITQLETDVNELTYKLDTTEGTLRDTKLILTATQHTEVCLTTEAMVLIDTVKQSISDGDHLHQDLVKKRQEDITRKVATKDHHKIQMDLLNELVINLNSISNHQKGHRIEIETLNQDSNSNQLLLLDEHTTVVEQMKNDCSLEIEVWKKIIDNGIIPSVKSLTSTSKHKLKVLSEILKDGDTNLQSHCQSVIDRLVENSARISEMETSYESSSNLVLTKLDSHLQESKTNLSNVVSEITKAIQKANVDRNQQRQTLNASIGIFQKQQDGSIDEMNTLSDSHVESVQQSIQSMKADQEESRTKIIDSTTNLDVFISTKHAEHVEKLNSQYDILTKQHEALKLSHQQQQEMNKGMIANVMNGMQTLIEKEMDSMGAFQSNNFTELVASNEESKSRNENINQSTIDTFQRLTTVNSQVSNDVSENFTKQEAVYVNLENQTSIFDTDVKKVITNHRDMTDTFIKESSDMIQGSEDQDRACTDSMINTVNCIENETNNLVAGIRTETENGISNLQDTTTAGWDYVRDEIVKKTQDDVTKKIQSSQKEVSIRAINDLETVDTVLDDGEKSIIDEINKGHETVSIVEKCLEVGVNETFLTSINKQKETIESSRWLEEAMNNHEKLMIDDVTKSSEVVSSTTKQLNHLTSSIIPVQEETPQIEDRDVLVFTEELTSTKESNIILMGATTCRSETEEEHENNGKENNHKDKVVPMDKDLPNDNDKKTTKTSSKGPQQAASPKVCVLKNRSTNESSSPPSPTSSTSSIPAKRRGVEKKGNNTKRQKGNKRTKVARKK